MGSCSSSKSAAASAAISDQLEKTRAQLKDTQAQLSQMKERLAAQAQSSSSSIADEVKAQTSDLAGKLDQLATQLAVLQATKTTSLEGIEAQIKEDAVNYMMKHFNIRWINDEIERSVYEDILGVIFALINKVV